LHHHYVLAQPSANFSRLAEDGITKNNTLFVINHFAGAAPAPAGCDGIHTPCTYLPGHKGEVDAN